MFRKDLSLFCNLLKKFRLKAEIESLGGLCDLLVEEGYIYEESSLSRWQNGSRVPAQRKTLLALINIFTQRGGITLLSEANQLMESANKGYLTKKELTKIPSHLLNNSPSQTPRITPYFTGRVKEVKRISKILARKEGSLIAIYGMAGVGKTVLAIRIAQLLQSWFPDGILWSRLDISSPMSILAKNANTFNKDVSHIKELEARSELVRSIIANKKALIIFDNAENSKQLRSILPGNTRCSIIVTSRNVNLETLSNASVVYLKPFNSRENLSFFSKKLGKKWISKYKRRAEYISKLVGSLPLALDIIINRIAKLNNASLTSFINELKKEKKRLTGLTYEDVNIRSSLKLSYESLASKEKVVFDCLGIFGGTDFSLEAVRSLLGRKTQWVKKILDKLADKSFVEYSIQGRYRLHPLIKLYAREHIKNNSSCLALSNFYVNKLDDIVGKNKFSDYPLLKLDIENITYLIELSIKNNKIDTVAKLWKNTSQFLFEIGLWNELIGLSQRIFDSCQLLRHQKLKAECAINLLSWTALWQGKLIKAQKMALKGFKIAKKIKNNRLIALAELRLGYIHYYNKNYQKATILLKSSKKNFQKLNNKAGVVRALICLGHIPQKQGNFEKAKKIFTQAIKLAKKINNKRAQCVVLTNLGNLAREEKKYEDAREYIIQSQELDRKTKRHDASRAWNNYRLALLEWDLKHYTRAEHYLVKASKKFKALDMKGVLKDSQIVLEQIKKHTHSKQGLYW